MGPRETEHPALVAFGHRVSDARRAQGLTQEQLAHRSGLDSTYISGIERGLRNVAVLNIIKLARALEVEPGDLLDGLRIRRRG